MKYTVVEYDQQGIDLNELLRSNISLDDLHNYVDIANKKIADSLHIKRNCLKISDNYLHAEGVAGIIDICEDIELEIIPKFIPYSGGNEWQSILYMLATLSKYGSILTNDRIHSSTSYVNSLYDIAGRILADEYVKNYRNIIRQYNRKTFYDYSIDGEINFDVLFERDPDGIEQTQVKFDRFNTYNSTLKYAMEFVKPYVSDNQTRNILDHAISDFGEQPIPDKKKVSLSPRNREWLLAYDLAFDILSGLGSSYDDGRLLAPGFIVDTWKLWQWLIAEGLILGFGSKNVKSQDCVLFGHKQLHEGKNNVNVYPDVEIFGESDGSIPICLVDAKYKLIDPENGEVERDDLYEAFAFCKGTNCTKILLAYPDSDFSKKAGQVTVLSTYYIEKVIVIVISIGFGTVSEQGGIYTFGNNFSKEVQQIVNHLDN